MIRFDRSLMRNGFGRETLFGLLEEGFVAIDPKRCVAECLAMNGGALRIGSHVFDTTSQRIWAIAIGKAAVPMAEAVSESLGPALAGGIAVTRYGYGGDVDRFRVFEAGHPIPDENGFRAATAIGDLTDRVGPKDVVLCLLSGGGSALLAELAASTELLLASGASIDAINTVRRHLSTLQGGRLAQRLHPSTTVTLALSDVVGDRLESIASGPTAPDPTTYADAIEVLKRHRIWDRFPLRVREHLTRGDTGEVDESPKLGDPLFRKGIVEIVGNNDSFLDAIEQAGRDAGWHVLRDSDPIVGEASGVGRRLGRRVAELAAQGARRTLLVAGGETTVTIRGDGRGGRNQELALAVALEVEGIEGTCIAALATDGSDGVTEVAGAIVDGTTIARVREAGIDPSCALADNDSHAALTVSDDLLVTGPTRTNVADVVVTLIDRS